MSYLAQSRGIQPFVLPDLGRDLSFLGDVKSYGRLKEVIQEFRPHIIHTHTAKAGTLGRLAGMRLNIGRGSNEKIRFVHTFHGHVFHSYFSPVRTLVFIHLERFLAKFTDRIIVVSPLQRHDICMKFRIARPGKVSVIPLGFDLSSFGNVNENRRRLRKEYFEQSSEDVLFVTIVGRLTQVKNHRMFLEAVRYVKDRGKGDSFRFLIVGDGELRKELSAYASILGIESSVVFAGWKRDMSSVYGAADIVALSSLNEGTPVTLIEGMAAGKPVIATEVGGVRDLLGEVDKDSGEGYKLARRGILVPSGGAKEMAEALLFAQANRGLLMAVADRAKDYVIAHYSVERLVGDLKALYNDLLKN
jgi:glycosyltransferase involved in cell wall biosynthesis